MPAMPIAEQIARRYLVCPVSHLPLVPDGEVLRVAGADHSYPLAGGSLPILLADPAAAAQRVAAMAQGGWPPTLAPDWRARIGRFLRGEGLRASAARRAWTEVAVGGGLRLAPGGDAWPAQRDANCVQVHSSTAAGADVVATPQSLPYGNGVAAGVILSGILERVERPAEILREAFRVLAPGGELFVASANLQPDRELPPRPHTLSARGLMDLVRAAGFEPLAAGSTSGPVAAACGLAHAAGRALFSAAPLSRLAGAAAVAALLPLRPLDALFTGRTRADHLAPAHWLRARRPRIALPPGPLRLHIGSGTVKLPGWLNLDLQALPGVDVVADVTQGLLFENVEAIYAEHFLEHLRIDHAVTFLADCWSALRPGGVVRLSTPNLDWVMGTHHVPATAPAELRIRSAISINLGFHGWRHQFLWNREMLAEALHACGFAGLSWHRHGDSGREVLRGIEHHETYADEPALPHVLIVEAEKSAAQPHRLRALRAQIATGFLKHLAQ